MASSFPHKDERDISTFDESIPSENIMLGLSNLSSTIYNPSCLRDSILESEQPSHLLQITMKNTYIDMFESPDSTDGKAEAQDDEVDSSTSETIAPHSSVSFEIVEKIISKLSNIRNELSQNIRRERKIILRESLNSISEEIEFIALRMTPEERKMLENELLEVESTYLNAFQENEGTTSTNHDIHSGSYTIRKSQARPFGYRKISGTEVKSLGINKTSSLKVLQMLLNAFSLLCWAYLSPELSVVCAYFWVVLSVSGLCIAIFSLWFIVRYSRNTSSSNYFIFTSDYCLIMTLLYAWTFCIIFANMDSTSQRTDIYALIVGILTITTYTLDGYHTMHLTFQTLTLQQGERMNND